MAIPLTTRNLQICFNCLNCVTGKKCRFMKQYKGKILFKMASYYSAANVEEQRKLYWNSYYNKNKNRLLLLRNDWYKNNKHKALIHSKTNESEHIKSNKPNVCSFCGKIGRIIAHHKSYNSHNIIAWLCSGCHKKVHIGTISNDQLTFTNYYEKPKKISWRATTSSLINDSPEDLA
jgi:hypothetical protein